MKKLHCILIAVCLAAPAVAFAQQDKPGAVISQSQEVVVTVRNVDREQRIVTVERPDGKLVTINVPPEAKNLDQVRPGSKFRVNYLESIAIFISPTGGEVGAAAAAVVELAEKGATPGGEDRQRPAVQACGPNRSRHAPRVWSRMVRRAHRGRIRQAFERGRPRHRGGALHRSAAMRMIEE
jgi:hypothetical protein